MMVDKSVKELLDAISSKAPTPGGGSVAALAGAISCSLAAMVCNLTIGKKKYESVEQKMKELLEKAMGLRKRFEELIDEDSKAFDEVMKAFKEGGDKQKAFKKAAEVPMETASLAKEAMSIAYYVAMHGNKNAISDAGSAAYMAYASFKMAEMNVKINLPYIEDEKIKKMAEDKIKEMEEEIEETFERVKEVLNQL